MSADFSGGEGVGRVYVVVVQKPSVCDGMHVYIPQIHPCALVCMFACLYVYIICIPMFVAELHSVVMYVSPASASVV